MSNEIKIGIAGLVIVLLIVIGLHMGKYYTEQYIIKEKIEAGLEECPIRPNSGYTLWVKSCKEYSEISKTYKSTKDKAR